MTPDERDNDEDEYSEASTSEPRDQASKPRRRISLPEKLADQPRSELVQLAAIRLEKSALMRRYSLLGIPHNFGAQSVALCGRLTSCDWNSEFCRNLESCGWNSSSCEVLVSCDWN